MPLGLSDGLGGGRMAKAIQRPLWEVVLSMNSPPERLCDLSLLPVDRAFLAGAPCSG